MTPYFFSVEFLHIQKEVDLSMADTIAYCVKCKKKQTMNDVKQVTMKNGRKASKGKCPVCGTSMFKIGG